MLNIRHSLLAESVGASLADLRGWLVAPEIPFSMYGERGVIDLLAYHAPSGSLLVTELKTLVMDVSELVRKARLAARRGWPLASLPSAARRRRL